MAKPKVFVTRVIPDVGLEMIRDACSTEIWKGELPPKRDVLGDAISGMDGILCLLTDTIDAEIMDMAGSGLRVISNYAVGFDNIDMQAAAERGIPVGNTPGVLTDATADFAFGLLMAAARRVPEGDSYTRSGQWRTWEPQLLLGQDVTRATLGIVGCGRIGRGMAKRARGFDMRLLCYDPYCREDAFAAETGAEFTDLDTLLRESDYVSLHTPLTDSTHHLIGEDTLSKMKPTAILVNTARGPIVDPDALYRALSEGWIACAALDVTEPEPIPTHSPLLTLENIIITPHIASASVASRNAMAIMAAQNLIAGVRGVRLPNCVNPEVYTGH